MFHMAKRGRKRKGYFYEEQEQAVVDYLNAPNTSVKNQIFNNCLRPAFTKMIESIIRRYKLRPPDEEFDETFNDTISFLMTKIELFDPTKGFKAYSYCGTICKNYLIWKINNFKKIQSREEVYNDIYEVFDKGNEDLMTNTKDSQEEDLVNRLIKNISVEIRKIIDSEHEPELTENERIVGLALINLFENWEILEQELGSNKFNKSAILLYLKELTRLDTVTIRDSMLKYRKAYYSLKRLFLNELI